MTSKFFALSLLLSVAVTSIHCSDDGERDGNGGDSPSHEATRSQPPEPTPSREGVEDALGFLLIIPNHLPPLVASDPAYRALPETQTAEIAYYPKEGQTGADAPLIEITETTQPVQPGGSLTSLNLAGKTVLVDEFPGSTGASGASAAVTIYWIQGALHIEADFTWAGSGNVRLLLTDAMRQQAQQVVKSMIVQGG